jgi:hypothetical protein
MGAHHRRCPSEEEADVPETFRSEVELHGKTATGLRVPAEVVERLGQGKRARVVVTVGAHSYRSTVAARGGDFLLPMSAANREAAGVAAGDVVEVVLEPDLAERTVDVPDDRATALASEPAARTAFEALSASRQRQLVEAVTAARRAETRERRVATTVAGLLGG